MKKGNPVKRKGTCPCCKASGGFTGFRCIHKGHEIPIRCEHAVADKAAWDVWAGELYEQDGKKYAVVKTEPRDQGDGRMRRELDLTATLAGKPVERPASVPHMHLTCGNCGKEWVEKLGG